jgi:hypothetical protein
MMFGEWLIEATSSKSIRRIRNKFFLAKAMPGGHINGAQ